MNAFKELCDTSLYYDTSYEDYKDIKEMHTQLFIKDRILFMDYFLQKVSKIKKLKELGFKNDKDVS